MAATTEKTGFWTTWALPQAFVSGAGLILAAWAVQLLYPALRLTLPAPPWNWPVAIAPVALALGLGWGWPRCPRLAGVASAPSAIAAVTGFALCLLPVAIWPQGTAAPAWLARLGLADALTSLPLTLMGALVLAILAVATGRRIRQREPGWLRFTFLHLGLITVMLAVAAGSPGIQRGWIEVSCDGPPVAVARTADGQVLRLPTALKLQEFRLESWPPRLVVGKAEAAVAADALLGPGTAITIAGLKILVAEWLPAAGVVAGIPRECHQPGAHPAARVQVDHAGGSVVGWLHPPGLFGEGLGVTLPDGRRVEMEPPRARRFSAVVRTAARPQEAVKEAVTIEVNAPLKLDGWWIHLLAYDQRLGAASRSVTLEAVEDRALPGVWAGLALVALGVILHGFAATAAFRGKIQVETATGTGQGAPR